MLYEIAELIEKVIKLNTKDASAKRKEGASDDASILDGIPVPAPPPAHKPHQTAVVAQLQVPPMVQRPNQDLNRFKKPNLPTSVAQKQHQAAPSVAQRPNQKSMASLAQRYQQQIVSMKANQTSPVAHKPSQPPTISNKQEAHMFKQPLLPAREQDHSQIASKKSVQPTISSNKQGQAQMETQNAGQPTTLVQKPNQPLSNAQTASQPPIVTYQQGPPQHAAQLDLSTAIAQELATDFAMDQDVGMEMDQREIVAPQNPTQPSITANTQDHSRKIAQKPGNPSAMAPECSRTRDVSMEPEESDFLTPTKKRKLMTSDSKEQDRPTKISTIAAKKKDKPRYAKYARRYNGHSQPPAQNHVQAHSLGQPVAQIPNHSTIAAKKQDQSQIVAPSQSPTVAQTLDQAEKVPQPIADRPNISASLKQVSAHLRKHIL